MKTNIEAIAREIVQKIEDANFGFDFACEADREEAREIVASAVGANVGAGLVMLPREPNTRLGIIISSAARDEMENGGTAWEVFLRGYRAMLAAVGSDVRASELLEPK